MSDRVREKMEKSEHLEEDDHAWIRSVGMEVHPATTEVISKIPPGDSLHIAIMMPFLDQ